MIIPKSLASTSKPLGIDTYNEKDSLTSKDSKNKKNLRNFFNIVFKYKSSLISGVIASILTIGISIARPKILQYIVDFALEVKDYSALKFYLFIFIALEVISFFCTAAQTFFFVRLGQYVMHELRSKLFSHFLRLPLKTIDSIPSGALTSRLTTDVKFLSDMFESGFVRTAQNFLTAVAVIIAMFVLNAKLAAIALIALPLLMLASIPILKILFRTHRVLRKKLTSLNAFIDDSARGAELADQLNANQLFIDKGEWFNNEHSDFQLKLLKIKAFFQPAITIFTGLGVSCVIYFGSKLVAKNESTIGELIAFTSYLVWINWPLVHVIFKIDTLISGFASLERIFSSFNWESEELESSSSKDKDQTINKVLGKIEFQNVYFAYEDNNWILEDFNLTINSGESVGIVGKTGSGKSTLVSLLFRFYSPQRGRILLDGVDIASLPLDSLRKQLGFVQQDSWFFKGTVEENITLWQEKNENLDTILSENLFSSIPSKETIIENHGSNLSAGARQVLSFARTLFMNPYVWILDEATAHLDPILDQQLTEALNSYGNDKTRLIIAHRLSSVRSCDSIIVLKNGKLIEQGDHNTLMSLNGYYAKLNQMEPLHTIA